MKKITKLFALILLIQFASCSKDDTVINTAPIIKAQAFEVKEDAILSLKIVASDLEDDALTFSIKKDDNNLFAFLNDGTLRVQPGKKISPKTYLIDVEVSDGKLTSTATITIKVKAVA
ncbi:MULTISPECIES: cadherin repeat domain-containing protein [unclassified Tenacibaculum]|uniref:cadherin repeat domain-containing protein n=1 Tax=unclassified Tenacibaculum TaxID=2635139 RepID=UPI001F45C60B|nr:MULTISPECIES: cadherin repeat domain-containing protein [unclassified Tenacibaculum]MCF2875077.1 cadherin repeat domain-containing protein [Tenacibaculum sp. Cn5-1]MCF2935153.1 cadherin repeat domain-containing protein [Tenacibaculum sp. Cn5-34]MCG7511405.1 cadherin repeat domain-containing protein [Tenacibaculum sp. Cn5-46]